MIAPDMATMLAFVFTDAAIAAPACCRSCWPTRADKSLQLHHRRRRHLDQRHAAAGRHRRRPRHAPIDEADDPRPGRLPRALDERADRPRAAGRRATARAPPSSSTHRRRRGAASNARGAQDRPGDRQLAAGQDRDRRRGRQLGPHRHGGRQVRRARPTATSSRSRSAACGSPTAAGVVPSYDEAPVAAHMQGPRHRDRRRSRHRPRPRHGLDLRSDARLHRHQRQLPFLSAAFDEECPGGPPPLGDRPLVLVAAVALVDADGRVLIAQRPAGKSMAGLWEFPGGKVDPGETPEAGADPRAARGARHRDRDELPGADRLRQPRLRDVPSADAGLRLPQVERHCRGRAKARR